MKKNKNNINNFLFGTLIVVLLIYLPSLFRPWQPFDEGMIYDETLFPIPQSFFETFEVIKKFVIGAHAESLNSTFSNYFAIRSVHFAWSILTFFSYLFKTNPFFYRLLLVLIHLINCVLVWFILHSIFKILKANYTTIFSSLFTLLWALHSANSEAILLATNWNGILTFTFCFSFILYEISRLTNNDFKNTLKRNILLPITFFIQMQFSEHGYSFPLIIFFIIFAFIYNDTNNLKKSFIRSLILSLPYFLGLVLYLVLNSLFSGITINSLFKSNNELIEITKYSNIYLFLERNLWLTPQIFIHFMKLLLFPKTLTLYQSTHVPLANSLFAPYAVFCSLAYLFVILFPILLLIFIKKQNIRMFCVLLYAFFASMLPYLHIITPTYCLIADRYCYFPSFLLILLFGYLFSNLKNYRGAITLLLCISIILGTRTFIRTNDWQNAYVLYESLIKVDKNPIYKGTKLAVLGDILGSQKFDEKAKIVFKEAIDELNKALHELSYLKQKYPTEPVTLKLYGLDYKTLLVKAAFRIAIIQREYYKLPLKQVIDYFESYIKDDYVLNSYTQIKFYADALIKDNQFEKAKRIIERGLKMYPYHLDILLQASDFYLEHEKNKENAFKLLDKSHRIFPNKGIVLYKLYKYYELEGDLLNQAKFAYLLGLRDHYVKGYHTAAKIYLDLNKLQLAKKSIDKAFGFGSNDPASLLLLCRYLDLIGDRNNIPILLNKAYIGSKNLGENQDLQVTKGILTSLINVSIHLKDYSSAKKYLNELYELKISSEEEIKQLQDLKLKLSGAKV